MNKFLPYLYGFFFVLVVSGTGFYLHEHPITIPVQFAAKPCATPIPYTIGTIDPRFKVSEQDVLSHLSEAAAIWNTAAGKTVLVYDPTNAHAMPVNFVYDTRQETVTLGKAIDSTEASQNSERDQITALQQAYLAKQQAYASAIASFNSDSQAYAAEVRRVNASGGADTQTYTRLNSEQAELKQRQTELDAQGKELDTEGKQIQARVSAFNADVRNINSVVQNFNASAAGDFEEGQYVRNSDGTQHIDIYAYKDESELIHSLTHEFGHAIGLEHNSNPASIMFPYNRSGTTLSVDDKAALEEVCGTS